MKKKVLLSSIATIALCLSLIAGSTFALFTDKTDFNIAVTSGDVEILATTGIKNVYSAKGTDDDIAKDEYLKDENGHGYFHELQNKTDGDRHYFVNGGYAVVEGANLIIDKITPGDRVDVVVKVENKSNVAMSYRYKIIAADVNLAYGMVVSVGDNTFDPNVQLSDEQLIGYEGLATWTSKWYPVIPTDGKSGEGMEIPDFVFTIELPVYAGNEYQTERTADKIESVSYTVLVEAVQGNAVTDDESVATIFPEALARRLARGGIVDGNGAVVEADRKVMLNNDITLTNMTFNTDNLFSYELLAVNGNSGTRNLVLDEGTILNVARENGIGLHVLFGKNHKVTVKSGAKINATGKNAQGLFFQETDNVTIVLEETGLIEAANGCWGIGFENVGVANIYVPSAEAYETYKAMTNISGAKTVNWYVGGTQINQSYTSPFVGNSEGTGYEGDLFEPGATDFLVFQNAVLFGNANITIKRTYNTVALEDVVADVNGNLITADCDNTIILHNCDITLDEGAKLIVTTNGATVGQVMIHNVTVNGVLLTQETAAQYMEGVNWYQVW